MTLFPHGWPVALAMVLIAAAIDIVLGEPHPAFHPVVWMGRIIGALDARRPRGKPRLEIVYGALIVAVLVVLSALVGVGLLFVLAWLPAPLAALVGGVVLKTTFSLRGLVAAAHDVRRDLAVDLVRARVDLAALVSRDRDLDAPLIVSATVESLAENLVDSVVAPLLAFAVLGLPGALVYRSINTMDAMVGYRGDYEYVGKAAARLDDVVNWIPARLTGLLLVLLASLHGTAQHAWTTLRRHRHLSTSPNKLWTIAPMAGALRVRLSRPGSYAVGWPDRPLTAGIIREAAALVWTAGGIVIVAAAAVAAIVAWAAGG
ncbi:MAG: adenosylcobinamide-phosphate synthase CbiB [Thermoleophilia bacterium]